MQLGSSSQNVNRGMLRIDHSRALEYAYPKPPKRTFGQKLARFFGGLGQILLPFSSLAAVFAPGPGHIAAAGAYGLNNVIGRAMYKSDLKEMAKQQAYQSELSHRIDFPGLFNSSAPTEGDLSTEFMAPTEFHANISDVLIHRSQANQNAMSEFHSR